ncbi:MAG: UDP-N-acetylmuramate dehydrogenase [Alphaproteobacteria bacterium]|nr:UDP-N-acetylmuramate dehydrogenase [Alphaproteobacteria bacterium]
MTHTEMDLIHRLPKVRGAYTAQADLAKQVWFRAGGPAEVLFKPADVDDLSFFLKEKPRDVPINIIGVGSNLLIRDLGVPGVVIRLGKGFSNIAFHNSSVDVGAAVLDRTLSLCACDESIEGLEFFSGIPGTIGGALRMNAGCYGTEIKDILEAAFALDSRGTLHQLTNEEMRFGYRECSIPQDWFFIGARFKARAGRKAIIAEKINKLMADREESQPVKSRTGGSTFANPPGMKAWELIDQAGCRGFVVGDAQVSEKHCNFLINRGNATANDLEKLGLEVQSRVLKTSGIDLKWEIKRMGISEEQLKLKSKAA